MRAPGRQAGLLDGALLDAGDAGGHADDDARVRPAVLVDLLDEVAEHLLGDVEVGDHAVLERPDRLDRARRAPEHALGLDADRVHFAGARVDRDDARLGQHDAAPAHVHERVGRAEIDRHVAAAETGQIAEDAHMSRERARCGASQRRCAGGARARAARISGAPAGRSVANASAGAMRRRFAATPCSAGSRVAQRSPRAAPGRGRAAPPAAGRRRSRSRPSTQRTSAAPAPWIA